MLQVTEGLGLRYAGLVQNIRLHHKEYQESTLIVLELVLPREKLK